MSEFQFAWPWVWLLLLLPLLSLALPPAAAGISGAVKVPFFKQMESTSTGSKLRRILTLLAAILIWLMLTGAAARPQWVGEPESFPVSGRDLLLAPAAGRQAGGGGIYRTAPR
jgi:Ca-activated chloride channel family protein